MNFDAFVEGPLLWTAFIIFLVGVLIRITVFAGTVLKAGRQKDGAASGPFMVILRSLIPFHMGLLSKPVYSLLRYVFHICLFAVPIWLTGHVALWSESRFGWEWISLPDPWADGMTLIVLGLAGYFILRRVLSVAVRHHSSASDFVLLVLTTAPFLSGYFLMHGTLDHLAFPGNHIRTIHVLSGEVMLVIAAFLFCGTRVNREKCTGCAACEANCPTATLIFKDAGRIRTFFYAISQCICCGGCVGVCPEEAAELRHEMRFRKFLRLFAREKIGSVELAVCEGCRALFAPEPLLDRIGQNIADDYRHYCSTCKKSQLAANFYKLAPWPERRKERRT